MRGVADADAVIAGIGHRATVDLTHTYSPDDDAGETEALLGELGGASDRLQRIEADLGDAEAPRRQIERAIDAFGANTGWASAEQRER
jgi:hypothetical protein